MTPSYKAIEIELREKIVKGFYKHNEKLPIEEALSQSYGVSRGTLKKALARLRDDGLVVQIPGRGSFVCSAERAFAKRSATYRKRSRQESGKSIAILIPNIAESLYPEMVRGVEDVCHSNGYRLIMGSYDANPVKEAKHMRDFLKAGVSGMVIAPSYNSSGNDAYSLLVGKNIPFVLADVGVKGVEADLVSSDNIEGSYHATRYLLGRGCRRIVFVTGWLCSTSAQERLYGHKRALAESKPEVECVVKEGDYSEAFGRAVVSEIADMEADGILSCNEPITNGVLRAVCERGVSDVPIASFDDPQIPVGFGNDLLIVSQAKYEIGQAAAEVLLRRIGGWRTALRRILIRPHLSLKSRIATTHA